MKDHYLTYNPIDLATDDTFIQWVQNGRPEDHPWAIWLIAHPDKASDVNEASDLVQLIKIKADPSSETQIDDIWQRINTTIENEDQEVVKDNVVKMPRRNLFKIVGYTAAASVAALIVFQIFTASDENIYAEYGEQISHVLPDQSQIELNADSEISYNKSKWSTERKLSLQGEAYFKVEKGQKFAVHTNHGTVTVLGTSFNVYSREDGFLVHCTSGSVEVTSKNETVILTPGTKSYLNTEGKLSKEVMSTTSKVDWLDKVYRFDKIPLKVVFKAIERQFDVQITMDSGIAERLYTGSFEATELEKALNIVCYPMQLSPIIQGKKIRIQSDVGN